MTKSYSAPRAPFVCLIALLVAAGLAGLVVLNTAMDVDSFTLHRQSQRTQQLNTTEEQLRRDLEKEGAPSVLDANARGMGLVQEGTPAFIDTGTGTITGQATPAGSTVGGK